MTNRSHTIQRAGPVSANGAASFQPRATPQYVFSGVRPSSAAATSARSNGSVSPNATSSPCVSAPEDGRTPLNTYTPQERRAPRDRGLKARANRRAVGSGFQPSWFWGHETQGVALGWNEGGALPLGNATIAALDAESAEVLGNTKALP